MMAFHTFLEQRLAHSLPGEEAQNLMRPRPSSEVGLKFESHRPKSNDFRNSSVLAPIITWKEELEIILTLRTSGIKHGGQLSFPGGGKEGDETIEETALRESREEIGLREDNVIVAGNLTPLYVNHSNNMVTPVVGFIKEKQELIPNPNEVAEIFTVKFSELLESENHIRQDWDLRNTSYSVPFFDVHHVPLWGATAMMMSELLELYKEFRAV
ncbi:MAG: CoA pyrophosphatase [Balneolaceae bacterium]